MCWATMTSIILCGISVYIGIALIVYKLLVEFANADKDIWTAWFALCWIATLPMLLISSPFLLYFKLVELINKDKEKDQLEMMAYEILTELYKGEKK